MINVRKPKKTKKIIMISSSGGHYEQLSMLKPLEKENRLYWITEKTKYISKADYYLIQTGSKDKLFILKMVYNLIKSIWIFIIIRPKYVITTGTMVVIPMCFIAKLFRRKVIFIETFARIHDGTKTGKLMYKHADLFIVQWKELLDIYPDAVYGGSIY